MYPTLAQPGTLVSQAAVVWDSPGGVFGFRMSVSLIDHRSSLFAFNEKQRSGPFHPPAPDTSTLDHPFFVPGVGEEDYLRSRLPDCSIRLHAL